MEDNVKSDPERREDGQGIRSAAVCAAGRSDHLRRQRRRHSGRRRDLDAHAIWPPPIVAAVIITVLAFAVGMTLVILHNKRRR